MRRKRQPHSGLEKGVKDSHLCLAILSLWCLGDEVLSGSGRMLLGAQERGLS